MVLNIGVERLVTKERNNKYNEIQNKLMNRIYQQDVVMTKTLYPNYFIFDRTKDNIWNEHKVKVENKKISRSFRKPKPPFEKGSDFYNDLLEYVSLYGFNEEQAEVLLSCKLVAAIKEQDWKLSFLSRLVSSMSEIINEDQTVNHTVEDYLTYAELLKNHREGKYNCIVILKKLLVDGYIYDEKESAYWNQLQVELTNSVVKENNRVLKYKAHKEAKEREEYDVTSYLMGLNVSNSLSKYIAKDSTNLSKDLANYGVIITTVLGTDCFKVLNFYVDLINELRSKS